MSTRTYRLFGAYLVLWLVLLIGLWVNVQAYMNPHGGFGLGQIGKMIAHPYTYVVKDAVDPSAKWHSLSQVLHPYYFGFIAQFLLIAISACTFGVITARRYGGFSSSIGRAIIFFNVGTVLWGIGAVIWFYLNGCTKGWGWLHTCSTSYEAPYPSWPDLGYIMILPFAALALWELMRALRVPALGLLVLVLVLDHVGAMTYLAMRVLPHQFVLPHTTAMEKLTSYTYTASDIILLGMAVTLLVYSRRAAGGSYFPPMVAYAVAFLSLYVADMNFFPRAWKYGSYYNGDFTDLLYAVCLFLISVGTFLFARAEQKTLAQMREFEKMMTSAAPAAEAGAETAAPTADAGAEPEGDDATEPSDATTQGGE